MRALRLVGRAVTLLLFALVAVNALTPAVARAQFVAAGGASVTEVLAALVGQSVSTKSLTLTQSSGSVALQLSQDGAKICLGSNSNWCMYVDLGNQQILFPGGFRLGAGQNAQYDSWYPVQATVPPVIQGTKGFRVACISEANFARCVHWYDLKVGGYSARRIMVVAKNVATTTGTCSRGDGCPLEVRINALETIR